MINSFESPFHQFVHDQALHRSLNRLLLFTFGCVLAPWAIGTAEAASAETCSIISCRSQFLLLIQFTACKPVARASGLTGLVASSCETSRSWCCHYILPAHYTICADEILPG